MHTLTTFCTHFQHSQFNLTQGFCLYETVLVYNWIMSREKNLRANEIELEFLFRSSSVQVRFALNI